MIPFNQPVNLGSFNFSEFSDKMSKKLSAGGPIGLECEAQLNKINGCNNLLVPSATAALEMMALLTDVKPGDEVILPSFTFVSTANAFSLRGARIRFADNDSSGNITPSEIQRLITNKTKVVCVVHYAGHSCDMDTVVEICREKNIYLFEDAAQCIGSQYKGHALGSLGDFGCYSFHDTKNITSGEGGSLIVQNKKFLERAEIIREKGTNRKQFLRGQAEKYTWLDLGSSFCLSELNAAYLLPQLIDLEQINSNRIQTSQAYDEQLLSDFTSVGIKKLPVPDFNKTNAHMYALVLPDPALRDHFINSLKEEGVQAAFHYVPLHQSPFGKQYFENKLENCELLASTIIRLPLWYDMQKDQIEKVVEATKKVVKALS